MNYVLLLLTGHFLEFTLPLIPMALLLSWFGKKISKPDEINDNQVHHKQSQPDIGGFDNSDEHYRDLIENATDVIYRIDPTGNFTYVNPVAEFVSGYTEEELLGMHYLQIVSPDYRQQVEQFYVQQIREGIERTYKEFEVIAKSGQKMWFGQNVRMLKKGGALVGFQAMARDITDRHMAEQELKNNERRFRLFIKNTPAAVAMFDDRMNYLAVSDRWLAEYGLKRDDVIGHSHYELFPALESEWKEIFEVGLSGVTKKQEDLVETAGGRSRWIKWEIHPWTKNSGDIGGLIMYREDITRQKEHERELLKAREMAEDANIAKSRFISNVSHELRTPLNSILGYSQILQSEKGLEPEQYEFVKEIRRSGNQLLSMVNNIIELSKIDASKISYEETAFLIEDLVSEAVSPYREDFHSKNIELTVHYEKSIPASLKSDFEKVTAVLRQLLNNALKFTENGRVDIFVDFDEIESRRKEVMGLLEIRVKDTGIGVPEEKQKSIFNPFSKGSSEYKEGTGLGLTLASRLCRFLGGNIELQSAAGAGCLFTVSLPAKAVGKAFVEPAVLTLVQAGDEVSVNDVTECINSLDSKVKAAIRETLEMQDMEKLLRLEEHIEISALLPERILERIKKAARQYDYLFVNKLAESIE